jgi:Smg protein
MYEVLVFMFENYFSNHALPEENVIEQELAAAGFDESAITNAFDWYNQLKIMMKQPVTSQMEYLQCSRMFAEAELDKIDTESLGFLLFLEQAKVINSSERDMIMDRAMALNGKTVNLEQTRWITMMAMWSDGREKDYLFVEDAVFNPRGLTLH